MQLQLFLSGWDVLEDLFSDDLERFHKVLTMLIPFMDPEEVFLAKDLIFRIFERLGSRGPGIEKLGFNIFDG